ncbi:hypothetical protein [Mycobacterium sp. 1245499.0]|uniref:hypothetical protein n=1 Tax=Mycobacterium sp. 1245499.0 TaxID=1834074 RepID=UPI0018D4208D|nr:hypothetical protein [Mycobacterium sp. 1245499.0]
MVEIPWFYVDDAFADSKPVMRLDRALRNEAIGLWVRCGAWSAKEETDGHVPLDTVKQFGGTPRLIRALHEQAELWVENAPESWRNSREILFGNWQKWQKTRAENQARRKREAEKKSTYRAGKKGRDYVSTSSDSEMSTGDTPGDNGAVSEDLSTGDSTGESLYPDPTRPDPTLIPLVTSGGRGTSVDPRGPRPQCPRHKENSDDPCPDCMRGRLWDEAQEDIAREDDLAERRRLKELRENCPICKGSNWIPDTEPAKKCNHQEPCHA